ncbi:MAG: YicC/YloC family endoribonuclease [Gemmatimonadaceae bacterium]
MTGYGTAMGAVGSQRVTVELRTVNHRFFNPNIKLPSALSRWEGEVRDALRKAIARGHVSLTARLERDNAAPARVDEERFAAYAAQLRALQSRHGFTETLDMRTVLRMPDVMSGDTLDELPASPSDLLAIVRTALESLEQMRDAEGVRLAAILEERAASLEQAMGRIAVRAPGRLLAERDRLRQNVRELADGVDVDPMRLAQEIAVMADRLDVSEEIDRFRAHLDAFRAALHASDRSPVGKRLGFLLQELLREANTTGSKARDTAMMHDVVAVKEELERMAEQVENVE